MNKIRNYIVSLDEEVVVNKKLQFFEILTALLGGIVIGFLFAPSRNTNFGSNNVYHASASDKENDSKIGK